MNNIKLTLILIAIISSYLPLLGPPAFADEVEDFIRNGPPASFPSAVEATMWGCQVADVKVPGKHNCVLPWDVYDQPRKLIVYDEQKTGEFKQNEVLCLPNWKIELSFEDLFSPSQKVLSVDMWGGGTGAGYGISLLIVWRKDKFVPILLENTRDYLCPDPPFSKCYEFNAKNEFINKNSSKPSFTIIYSYSEGAEDDKNRKEVTWVDKLYWNEKTFSFYSSLDETTKLKKVPQLMKGKLERVLKARQSLNKLDLTKQCDVSFDAYFDQLTGL